VPLLRFSHDGMINARRRQDTDISVVEDWLIKGEIGTAQDDGHHLPFHFFTVLYRELENIDQESSTVQISSRCLPMDRSAGAGFKSGTGSCTQGVVRTSCILNSLRRLVSVAGRIEPDWELSVFETCSYHFAPVYTLYILCIY
jgi:hypothetical protein